MQDARDSKPGTGAKNLTKVVDGKTYVLYAGRWHVKVDRYEHVKCATCGTTYQRIDFRSALHAAFLCPNPQEPK